MRFRIPLLLLLLGAAGCAPALRHAPRDTLLPTQGADVPLLIMSGTLEAKVWIQGQGPFRFMVDTGFSTAVTLSESLADRINLPERETDVRFEGASGETVHARRAVHIGKLRLGDALFGDVDALVVDLAAMDVDGVLGFPLFAKCLLTLDYADQTLRLFKGRLPLPNGRDVLPMRTPPRSAGPTPQIPVQLGSHRAWALVDSGFSGAFEVPKPAQRSLVLRGPAREGRTYRTLGSHDTSLEAVLARPARIGRYQIDQPYVLIDQEYRLGTEVLQHFIITFDQVRHRVRLMRKDPLRP